MKILIICMVVYSLFESIYSINLDNSNQELSSFCNEYKNFKKIYLKKDIICHEDVLVCPFAVMVKGNGLITNETTFEFIPAFERNYKSNKHLKFSININWCSKDKDKFILDNTKIEIKYDYTDKIFMAKILLLFVIFYLCFCLIDYIYSNGDGWIDNNSSSKSNFNVNNLLLWHCLTSSSNKKKYYGKCN
jgi:hypothetical protein